MAEMYQAQAEASHFEKVLWCITRDKMLILSGQPSHGRVNLVGNLSCDVPVMHQYIVLSEIYSTFGALASQLVSRLLEE